MFPLFSTFFCIHFGMDSHMYLFIFLHYRIYMQIHMPLHANLHAKTTARASKTYYFGTDIFLALPNYISHVRLYKKMRFVMNYRIKNIEMYKQEKMT